MKSMLIPSHLSRFAIVAALLGLSLVSPSSATGQQSQGQNDVYGPSSSNFIQTGSSAFVDARAFGNGVLDFCGVLNTVLINVVKKNFPSGAIIDARGLPGTTSTSMTCGASPWGSGASYVNVPSTILLPAQQIVISAPWILPDGTKLIGEGAGGFEGSTPTLVSATTIQACNTSINNNNCPVNFSGSSMIQMGDSNCPGGTNGGICHSISTEDLSLDGENIAGTGILNMNSQELSYVNRVNLYRVGVGLNISTASSTLTAQNSGPYSNIVYNTGGSTGTCAEIEGLTSTRGIHGLTCQGSSDSPVAVLLASSNTTLEDVRIVGFFDGVRLGSPQYPTANGNVLRNIFGDTAEPVQSGQPGPVVRMWSRPTAETPGKRPSCRELKNCNSGMCKASATRSRICSRYPTAADRRIFASTKPKMAAQPGRSSSPTISRKPSTIASPSGGRTAVSRRGATMESITVAGFGVGYQNTNTLSDPILWLNPYFWFNAVGWSIGNVSTQTVHGGFFDSNTTAFAAPSPVGSYPSETICMEPHSWRIQPSLLITPTIMSAVQRFGCSGSIWKMVVRHPPRRIICVAA